MASSIASTLAGSEQATAAARRAASNWKANHSALQENHPELAATLEAEQADVEWVFGRDGYLTAQSGETWWSGCSVPLRSARYMMRTLDINGSIACMLHPDHAAQVRVVTDALQHPQGVIVLLPDLHALRVLLGCDDFSNELHAHRLWFACGEAWSAELRRMLDENPGLPTPTQFIRPVAADNTRHDDLVTPAQQIFAEINARRALELRNMLHASAGAPTAAWCIIAPSHFRVWEDAPRVLAKTLDGHEEQPIVRFDPDDPGSASSLALAKAAQACQAIVSANTGRADLPEVARLEIPWITWLTCPRIPSAAGRGPFDALLIADSSWSAPVIAAGWPAEKIAIASWPIEQEVPTSAAAGARSLAIIADLPPIEPPARVAEYSSQALLWEGIAQELEANPFALLHPDAFLDERMRQCQIEAGGLDRSLFIQGLIIPAYQRGLAGVIRRRGIPLRCHGAGWESVLGLEDCAAGPVRSRDELMNVCSSAAALVHCWPADHFHPIQTMGRPLLRAHGRNREAFLRDAVKIVQSSASAAAVAGEFLSPQLVRRFIPAL